MIDPALVNNLFDATVLDRDDAKVGAVKQVYLDHDSGAPRFVTVRTGFFGLSETFVPLEGASFDGERLRVPYDEATIKDAPRIDADGELRDEQQDRIQQYYEGGDEPDATALAEEDRRDRDVHDARDLHDARDPGDRRDHDDPDRDEPLAMPAPAPRADHPKHADLSRTPVEERADAPGGGPARGRVRLRRYVVIEQQETIAPAEPRERPVGEHAGPDDPDAGERPRRGDGAGAA